MTLAGKSTTLKQLIKDFKAKGVKAIVFDPFCKVDPGFKEAGAAFVTDNKELFLKTVWNSKGCLVICDEGGETVGRNDTSTQDLFTKGRHNFHIIAVGCQRLTQIPPICRDQCTKLFLFTSSYEDGKILANEFNGPALKNCSKLKKGQFFYKEKFGPVQLRRMF